jgi:hypothetical protein
LTNILGHDITKNIPFGGYKMKRTGFLTIFLMLIFSSQIIAQTRPIMGYDKVAWGSTEAQVREIYGIGSEATHILDQSDSKMYRIVQKNVSDTITERGFWFIDDTLYRVYVQYKDTSDATAENLQSVLINRFGDRTDYNMDTGTTYLMFQQLRYTTETSIYGRYAPELVVELIHTVIYAGYEKDTNNLLGQNSLIVRYTWKKFRDEYQASKLGL